MRAMRVRVCDKCRLTSETLIVIFFLEFLALVPGMCAAHASHKRNKNS